ncbi:MAG: hypothetical protein AAF502_02275 [Bacteroidota bacterium]
MLLADFKKLSVFFVLLMLIACGEEEVIITPPTPTTASLTVTVVSCDVQNDPFCDNTTPINQAEVKLYENANDRNNETNPISSCLTNSSGVCNFLGLTNENQFIQVKASGFGTMDEEENTPANTISFLEVIFFQ